MACATNAPARAPAGAPAIVIESRPLAAPAPCEGRFVTHILDHTTQVPGDDVRMFAANGGGAALGDLDGDDDLDIVLANHARPNTILWNEGALSFRVERLAVGDSRAVNLVDVDGDGRLDIVFTRRVTALNFWRNEGGGRFAQTLLPGVDKPLYAIDWGDVDGDGDLDLAGASYDAALLTEFGADFLAGGQGGVYVFTNENGRFRGQRLAARAQALALELADIDNDDRLDLLVGNDFGLPDAAWRWTDAGWESFEPFAVTTHSTMSFDHADVDNDGRWEIFATDMKPYATDPDTLAAWQPIMDDMAADVAPPGDRQTMANVLQKPDPTGLYRDIAPERGLDASGWSWSARFGDLDRDGHLDLYVVNGFMEASTFGHLPNGELVEANQVFQNRVSEGFLRRPDWGLGSTASGRGMTMGDLDGDGDLDIVVNNLQSPAELLENRLCGGASVVVALAWPGAANSHAVGTIVRLQTSPQRWQSRRIRVGAGYLSGDPPEAVFGLPDDVSATIIDIRWPDGQISRLDEVTPGTKLRVTRQ